jgi:2-polyprenyl-3-methyl-5-hydroxy-6-metoxy-1,4-benzoquinol methylase
VHTVVTCDRAKWNLMLAQRFYDTLIVEVTDSTGGLHAEQHRELRRYYHALANNPRRRPFYHYNWTRRTAPMVRLLMTLPRRDAPWRVLDAGCGVGTESIFWAVLRDDVEVVGVDICAGRLHVAEARRLVYERRLGKSLNVRFLHQNVFRVLKTERFDVVWTMEAISHIDPAEKFLADVYENLDDKGYAVITDSHVLNPAMAWRLFKLRCQGVAQHSRKAMSTGETISYAQERLFTVGQLAKMLKQAGFASVWGQLSIFFPPVLAQFPALFRVCTWGDVALNKVPLIRNLGGIYTVVASK